VSKDTKDTQNSTDTSKETLGKDISKGDANDTHEDASGLIEDTTINDTSRETSGLTNYTSDDTGRDTSGLANYTHEDTSGLDDTHEDTTGLIEDTGGAIEAHVTPVGKPMITFMPLTLMTLLAA
jgi:hypothetical protein